MAIAQSDDALAEAAAFTTALEAAAHSPAGAEAFSAQYGDDIGVELLDNHLAAIRDQLARTPEDPDALLLSVRLGRIRDAFAWQEGLADAFTDSVSAESMTLPAVDPHLAVVDRILERHPGSAAAHHWKARLLVEGPLVELGGIGGWIPWPLRTGESTEWDATPALDHARRAVELDPNDALYREFLAVQLVLDGQIGAARDVMRAGAAPDDPLRLLIEDLEALGVPPEASPNPALQAFQLRVALMGAADSGNLAYIDHAEVRYLAWTVALPLADLEAFYSARWPGLRFIASAAWDGTGYEAALIDTADGWTPVADMAALEEGAFDEADAVTLLVLPPEISAALTQPTAPGIDSDLDGGHDLALLYMNLRRGPWAGGGQSAPLPDERTAPEEPEALGGRPSFDAAETSIQVATGPVEGSYLVVGNERIGLIDSLGTVVVEPQFSFLIEWGINPRDPPGRTLSSWVGAFGAARLTALPVFAVRAGQTGLLTDDGRFVPIDGLEWDAWGPAKELWRIRRNGKYGFVDAGGTVVVAPEYDDAGLFQQGHGFVAVGTKWGVVDRTGGMTVPPTWDEVAQRGYGTVPLVEVREGKRWGVVDRTGRTVVPVQYAEISFGTGNSGWIAVRDGNRWGVLDSLGTVIARPRFEPMSRSFSWNPVRFPAPAAARLLGVREDGQVRYVRFDGSVAFDVTCPGTKRCTCEAQGFQGALAVVECDGRPGVIDSTGRWVIEPTREGRISILNDSVVTVAFGEFGTKDGPPPTVTMTVDGQVLNTDPAEGMRTTGEASEGLQAVCTPWDTTTQRQTCGFVDPAGRLVIPARFESVGSFRDGIAQARENGRRGFIDRTGQWVIPPVWDDLTHFNGPLAVGTRQHDDCSLTLTHIDRANRTVFETTTPPVTRLLNFDNEACRRRLEQTAR